MALITEAEAKDYLPGLGASAESTLIGYLIARVDVVFARYLGYDETIEDTTYTEYLDGPTLDDAEAIKLGVRPVVSVTTIHDDPDWSYGSGDLVDSGDYTVDLAMGVVHLNPTASHAWSTSKRAIKVVYVAGYATVPADIKQAACLTVAHWYRLTTRQGKTSASGQGASKAYTAATIPDEAKELLNGRILGRAIL